MTTGWKATNEHPAEIWVSPRRMGGAPCIYGHRLTTRAIARLAQDGGVALVQKLYPYLTVEQVNAAVWFEGEHGRSKRFRRWYRDQWRAG